MSESERLEDHLPATLPFPCWGRLRACRVFTQNQMWGYTASQLAAAMQHRSDDCGDCDLFQNQMRLQKAEKDREELGRRQAATDRANRNAIRESEL